MFPAGELNIFIVAKRSTRRWERPSLTTRIMIGLVAGVVIGAIWPDWGSKLFFLRDIFLNLIKSIIAPLVFSTIVVGIAGAGALRKVGRMGAKALIYFEIVTTAALFIGLAVVNIVRPGAGVILASTNTDVIKTISQSHPKTPIATVSGDRRHYVESHLHVPTVADWRELLGQVDVVSVCSPASTHAQIVRA